MLIAVDAQNRVCLGPRGHGNRVHWECVDLLYIVVFSKATGTGMDANVWQTKWTVMLLFPLPFFFFFFFWVFVIVVACALHTEYPWTLLRVSVHHDH